LTVLETSATVQKAEIVHKLYDAIYRQAYSSISL